MLNVKESSVTRPRCRSFVSRVAAVGDRSPRLREIVLEGGLDDFVSSGGDQFVYVMVRGRDGADVPAGHTMEAQLAADPCDRPIAAYYTVRAWDRARRRLTLWMVDHDDDAGVGGWAQRCEVGERVALWGPRPGPSTPAAASRFVFVADESGFAAVAARVDELCPGASAHVIVETVDPCHRIEFPRAGQLTVDWRYRHDTRPGTGTGLLDAIRSLGLPADPRSGVFVFGAGEARQMARIRHHLRHEAGLAADAVSVTAYWRRTSPR